MFHYLLIVSFVGISSQCNLFLELAFSIGFVGKHDQCRERQNHFQFHCHDDIVRCGCEQMLKEIPAIMS